MSTLKFAARFVAPIFRTVRSTGAAALRIFMRILFWELLPRSRPLRTALFDSAPKGSVLLSNIGSETFVVISHDLGIGREVFRRGSYDFEKLQRAIRMLPKGFKPKLLIDVGANIGTICIPAVKRNIFETAIAIEPEPRNYSLLIANIHLNQVQQRIQPHRIALGPEAGKILVLELSEINLGDHRVRISSAPGQSGEEFRKTVKVATERFDDVIGTTDPTSTLIWIDTQGFEGYVLSGASGALRNRTPLVIEFWPYGMERSGSYGALKRALVEAGYKSFFILDGSQEALALSEESLDDLALKLGGGESYTDLLIC